MSDAHAGTRPRRSRNIAGRTVRRWLVDILLIALGVASVAFEPVSIAIHSVVGLVFAAAVGPHLWDRRRWIAGTAARLRHRRRMPARRRWNAAQALLLFALTVVMTAFGLWDWLVAPTKIRYHAIAGVLLIAVSTWHGWTRRRSLARWPTTAGHRLRRDSGATPSAAAGAGGELEGQER
jgi:hypothetical protein